MVVGAGRGPLVRCALRAAKNSARKIKLFAVEKNPNAIITYIHIYTYICLLCFVYILYVHVCMYICFFMCILHIYTCMFTCIRAGIFICTCMFYSLNNTEVVYAFMHMCAI